MKIRFDDWVERYDDQDRWACVCKNCVKKYGIPMQYLDDEGNDEICGVEGCDNIASYYIDFPADDSTTELENGHLEFAFEEDNDGESGKSI